MKKKVHFCPFSSDFLKMKKLFKNYKKPRFGQIQPPTSRKYRHIYNFPTKKYILTRLKFVPAI